MNNIELYIIKFFFNHKAFLQFSHLFELKFMRDNSPELASLFEAVSQWHDRRKEDIPGAAEFTLFFFTTFPEKENELHKALLSKLGDISVDEAVAKDYLMVHKRRAMATKASLMALEVAQGRREYQDLATAWQEFTDDPEQTSGVSDFVEPDDSEGRPPEGLRWRLDCLNKSLGSLRKGDFGFEFARPEAGKTTKALDQGTFMCEQLVKHESPGIIDGPLLYCNNEQPGDVMMERAICACLGINQEQYFKYKKQAIEKFKVRTGGRFLLYDKAHMTARDIERLVLKYKPGLIIFDQLDNIKGFSGKADREDLSLKAMYQWARELAKEQCPVIGLTQCGASGEGKKWLTMDDVDGSKTGKQSAADWIIGLGKSNQDGLESIRHISISKNKLRGDVDTDPTLRHGRMDVRIRPDICRFEDIK